MTINIQLLLSTEHPIEMYHACIYWPTCIIKLNEANQKGACKCWLYRSLQIQDPTRAEAWVQITHKAPIVRWWKLIWFSKSIPRRAFISWLAITDELTTKESLAKWGFRVGLVSVLCRLKIESKNHPFFKWSFAKRVGEEIKEFSLQKI